MSKAFRPHNLGPTVAMVLIAALLVLVALVLVARQTATNGERVDVPAISADRAGGSSLDSDPYIDRHAEVVSRMLR